MSAVAVMTAPLLLHVISENIPCVQALSAAVSAVATVVVVPPEPTTDIEIPPIVIEYVVAAS